ALRLSNEDCKRLISIATYYDEALNTPLDELALHRFWFKHQEAGIDLCLLALAVKLAKEGQHLQQDEWIKTLTHVQSLLSAYFDRYDTVVNPTPLVNGEDLMSALNLKPGKQIGFLLAQLREAQATGQIHNREDALRFALSQLS